MPALIAREIIGELAASIFAEETSKNHESCHATRADLEGAAGG
jgi:hypothetical protein